MIRLGDIEKRLQQQRQDDVKQLRSNYAKQNKLRPYQLRLRDLENDAKLREERLRRVVALIGEEKFHDLRKQMAVGNDVSKGIALAMDGELPLWLAMKAIVEQVPEIQVVELQDALAHFGKKASRQSVESALASHKEAFETIRRGRNKFVSLKR